MLCGFDGGAAYGVVVEAEFVEVLAAVEVAAVEDDFAVHGLGEFGEIRAFELCPVGRDDEGVCSLGTFVEIIEDLDGVAHFFGDIFGGDGVVSAAGDAVAEGFADEGEGGCFSDVIGAWFEGEAPECEGFALESCFASEVVEYFFEEEVSLSFVGAVDGVGELGIDTGPVAHHDAGEGVFGKA